MLYRKAIIMKEKLSVKNIALAVLNILSALMFLLLPQFSRGYIYLTNNKELFSMFNLSVLDLLKSGVSHRTALFAAVAIGILMTVLSVAMFLLKKVKIGRITAFFLPALEIILMFGVIFNLLVLPSGENLFFSTFVTPVGLTVFFVSFISLLL